MKLRGRPKTNGVMPAWVLHRTMVGLYAYDKARSRGEKYEQALRAAVKDVRQTFPEMRMSETEMKRILAEFRSKALALTFLVTESENTVTIEGRKCRKAWQLSIGPQPEYPRHNAREHRAPAEVRDRALPAKKL
jgi:hypothetical protein